MNKRIELNPEQTKAYNRFILARDRVKNSKTWVRPCEISHCIDVVGLNHPLYVQNDAYIEYQEAFRAWLIVEPHFREKERMRAYKNDYVTQDNWGDKIDKVKEL